MPRSSMFGKLAGSPTMPHVFVAEAGDRAMVASASKRVRVAIWPKACAHRSANQQATRNPDRTQFGGRIGRTAEKRRRADRKAAARLDQALSASAQTKTDST